MQYCEYKSEHYELGRKLPEERMNELETKYREAYWKLKKVTDIGGFVVSKGAADVLTDLKKRLC